MQNFQVGTKAPLKLHYNLTSLQNTDHSVLF